MAKVLCIGDIHEPVSRPGYLKFNKDLAKDYKVNTIVFMGDIVDWHGISFHAHNPNCPGASDEYELALFKIQKWYKAFKNYKVIVCIGNHDARPKRLAESVQIPAKLLRDYNEQWKTPGWKWVTSTIIDDVFYCHGHGKGGGINPAYNTAKNMGMSVVMGHFHSKGGVKWLVNPLRRWFGMDVGCVDKDTEYLTPQGWRKIGDYVEGELVGQYNSGKLEFVKPNSYIKVPAKTLNHFSTKYGLCQTICDEHNVVYVNRSGSIKTIKAKDMVVQHNKDSNGFRGKFITNFTKSGNCGWTNAQLMVQVAFLADGTISKDEYQYTRIQLKKDRKKDRLRKLLTAAKIKWHEVEYKNGCTGFYFEPPEITKAIPSAWYKANSEQLTVIANESLMWDGNQKNMFDTVNKDIADFIQYAFAASGRTARIISGNGTYRVCIRLKDGLPSLASTNKAKIKKVKTLDGFKYCFNVPSHMLILRKNGCIFITGNCGIDDKAFAFAYAKEQTYRSVLSSGVIINGEPQHIMMKCGKGEPYHDSCFKGK